MLTNESKKLGTGRESFCFSISCTNNRWLFEEGPVGAGCWGSGFILIGDQVETGVISRFKVRDGHNVYHPSPKIHIRQIEARTDISGEIFQRKSFG